jgi:MYXO-CTERM domain-containing protein
MKHMSRLRTVITTAFCLSLMGAAFAPGAMADDWNRKTVMTFSGPVEIPGVHLKGWGVLPAGTYVFKIMDSLSDRHIVQIFNKDETIIYATILAIPNYRLKATDKTVVTFRERPAGQPEALRAWFYPGKNWGEEFVYPRTKAVELAKATNMVVLYTATEIPAEVEESTATVFEPVVVQLKRAPIMAIKPTGEDVEIAAVVETPPAAELKPDTAPMEEKTLPATASSLPLIGLLGLLALGGAFALRQVQKRVL